MLIRSSRESVSKSQFSRACIVKRLSYSSDFICFCFFFLLLLYL